MSKISITRALTKIKVLKTSLGSQANAAYELVSTHLEKDKDLETVKQAKVESQSGYDEFNSNYKELGKLIHAVHKSNMETTVTLSGVTMTVAEALIKKDIIQTRYKFLMDLLAAHNNAEKKVQNAEAKIEEKARQFIKDLKIDSSNKEQLEQALSIGRTSAIRDTRLMIVEGFNVKKVREELDKVNEFIEEVDYVLSESNSITTVEI